MLFAVIYDLPYSYKLRESCPSAHPCVRLTICRTPSEATLYLRGVGIYADREQYPLPDLVLLDTQTPSVLDQTLLTFLKQTPQFAATPIVMLVDDPEDRHLQKDLDAGANGYLVKRDDLTGLEQIIESIQELKLLESEQKPNLLL